jgi:glycosyltransferase involved in cell wall biosynthesis
VAKEMRILFVTNFFQPEPNFFMGLPFAKELARRGHKVEVLTGFPNYPGGKLYDGYKIRPLQREVMDGIPVIRVPLYPSHDRSAVRRIATYATFALSASTIGTAAVSSADVAYVTQGPASIGLPGFILKLFRRIPFVYDIKDLWPDALSATGMLTNRSAVWMTGQWCKFSYFCASKVTVITPGYKKILIERGVPEHKLEVIYNWCDESHIAPAEKDHKLADELGMTGKFNIVFAGNIGKAQAIEAVIYAAQLIAADCPDVQFLFFGGGLDVDSLKQKVTDLGLHNVRFFERRPLSQISSILSLADVLLVHLRDEPVYRITIPSKTQAYMAVGKPILAAVGGDTNNLVLRAKAGLACEPEDSEAIAQTIRKFRAMSPDELSRMGADGRKFYQQNLSFDIAVSKYEEVFKAVAEKQKSKGGT